MGRPGKAHRRLAWLRGGLLPALLLGALAALGACGKDVEIRDTSGLPWIEQDGACVRQSEEGPVRRAINRVDPELCGRFVKHRKQVYVRVVPPPGMRSP